MECSRCKATIPEGSKFCIECGASVSAACPTCQNINPPQAKFCGKCGTELIGDATESPPSMPPKSGRTTSSAERRQVTVMFCDLVGSTALATRLDPEDLRDVIAAYHRCVATNVTSWRGFVAKYCCAIAKILSIGATPSLFGQSLPKRMRSSPNTSISTSSRAR